MSAAFTPGPWCLDAEGDTDVIASNGNFIASCDGGGEDGEYETDLANARLIAAAPDLLEALDWLVQLLPDPELDNDEFQRVWTRKARAAIAKATGAAS